MGGVSAAVSKTAAAPIERVKLLIQNQVSTHCHHSHQVASALLHLQSSHATVVYHTLSDH